MDLIITILPEGPPISPRFTPYEFLSRFKFSTPTTRQPMVELYLLAFRSTDSILGPNDHFRKCDVIRQSRLRVIPTHTYALVRASFQQIHTQRADSVTRFDLAQNLDLAPSSELRYLGRSASRQSSLPINRDCQQTATNYLLYQSRT